MKKMINGDVVTVTATEEAGILAQWAEGETDLAAMEAEKMELRLEAYTDEVAQNGPRRYRHAESCVSYITTSKDPQVVAEAQAFADWRDDFWNAAEAIKAGVLDGIRTAPTYEEAIAELPQMVWP